MPAPTFEFELGANQFVGTRLDAIEQAKILKRVTALIPPLIPFITQLDIDPKNIDLTKLSKLAAPAAEALANLPDDDLVWLIQTCAASVRYVQDGKPQTFWNRAAKRCMFKDLDDLTVLLPLTIHIIIENLSPFFAAMLTKAGAKGTETTTE